MWGVMSLVDLRLSLIIFHDFPEALAGHALAVHVDEQCRLLLARQPGTHSLDIVTQSLHRPGIQRDDPFSFFAAAAQKRRLQIHILPIQRNKLRHPDAGGVQQLQHGPVPEPFFVHALGLLQEQLHFPARQDLRALPLRLCGGNALSRVGLHGVGNHQVIVERFDGRSASDNGGRRAAPVRQVGQVIGHGGRLDPAQVAALRQPGAKLCDVPDIGADRVGGGVLFLLQIDAVLSDIVRHARFLLSLFTVHGR